MKTLELKKGITWLGSLDPDLRIFDIVMHTEFGTTYNSYLVQGSEKAALFETVKVKYFDQFVERLSSLTDISKLDYIVVDHTEPDHAGSIEKLLDLAPHAKVVGSSAAIKFLKAIANRDFAFEIANPDSPISLGDKTLNFIAAPFLHWPDSIYTYIPEDQTLITCDSFGSHYSFDEILFSKVTDKEGYNRALKYYYTMIMGPFKPHVLSAIAKIEPLAIDMICPGHGPVLDENPWEIVNTYKDWSTEFNPNKKLTVIIPYVAAYGYTESLAKAIAKGVESSGDIDVKLYDMVYADKNDVLGEIRWADGVLFGSPTINGDALPPIWDLLMNMSPIVHGRKLAAAFGSYGWSGEAVPNLDSRMRSLRLKLYAEGLKVNFKPSENELQYAFDYGYGFGLKLQGKDQDQPLPMDTKEPSHDTLSTEPKQWRCVVCNEVFEGIEAPDICPACGASKDQFEVYDVPVVTFKSDLKSNVLIIGNHAAGVSAASAIRERNTEATIEILTKEDCIGYYRPMLSDYISDTHQENLFYLQSEEWYETNAIKLSLSTEVAAIHPTENRVSLKDGTSRYYDNLILANGSENYIPHITEIRKEGVFTLKTKKDADDIKAASEKANTIVIIGGGILGLEAAWELKKRGKKVIVLEREDRALPRQLDHEASSVFEAGIEKAGVDFYKNTSASIIMGDKKVEGVQLVDGELIRCDMVIVSVGIVPNTTLAKEAGIATRKGILVDAAMKTNIANIYAAGDVCEFEDTVYGLWPTAVEQGKIAGANCVGDTISYKKSIPANVFNGMHMNVFSIGDLGYDPHLNYRQVSHVEIHKGIYRKLYFAQDTFVGGILIGDVRHSVALMQGIAKGAAVGEMVEKVILK